MDRGRNNRKRTFGEMIAGDDGLFTSGNSPKEQRLITNPVELAQSKDWNSLESMIPYYACNHPANQDLTDAIRLLFAFEQFDRLQHCIENNWITETLLMDCIESVIEEFSADIGCVDALGQRTSNFFEHLRKRDYLKTIRSNPTFSLIERLFSSGSTIGQFKFEGIKKKNILQLKGIFLNSVLLNFNKVKGSSRVLCWSTNELRQLVSIFKNITGLSLRKNNLKSLDIESIVSKANTFPAFFDKVIYLDLSENDLDKMPCLCEFLNLFPNLKALKLESVEFLKVLAMGRFGKQSFVKITSLSLNENMLHELDKQENENFQYLNSIFPNVTSLYLNRNDLYAMKSSKIKAFREAFPHVTALYLNRNYLHMMEPVKIKAFREAFPLVTKLYLSNNGLNKLQKCQLDVALSLWHEAFPQLRFIDISHNGLKSNIDAIKKIFESFDYLEGIDLSGNDLVQKSVLRKTNVSESQYITLFKHAFQNKAPFDDKNIFYIAGIDTDNGFSTDAKADLEQFCENRSQPISQMGLFSTNPLPKAIEEEMDRFRPQLRLQ